MRPNSASVRREYGNRPPNCRLERAGEARRSAVVFGRQRDAWLTTVFALTVCCVDGPVRRQSDDSASSEMGRSRRLRLRDSLAPGACCWTLHQLLPLWIVVPRVADLFHDGDGTA